MYLRITYVALCLICFQSNFGIAASFNCGHTSSVLEKTICSDHQLSKSDEELANYYDKIIKSIDSKRSNDLLHEQRAWLRQRTKECAVDDSLCLLGSYNDRFQLLRNKYENMLPIEASSSNNPPLLKGRCSFIDQVFPEYFSIFAAGRYNGRILDVQIDQSGYQSTQFDIIVNAPNKPTALLLGAYEPSIWNIGFTKGTKILAVVVTGYHRQVIAGLPRETPILISTYDNKGPCGDIWVSERKLGEINPFSDKVFGRQVDMVYFADDSGKIVIGEPLKPGEQIFTSADVTPDFFFDKKKPLAGIAGIKEAAKKGLLRPATIEDASEWGKRKGKMTPGPGLPPVHGGTDPQKRLGPRGDDVFVLLKAFHFTSELHSGLSAIFYLPEGVPYPTLDKDIEPFISIYDFNTMTCRGPLCDPGL